MRQGLFFPPFDGVADPHRLVDLARAAEASGWDGLFLWDHLLYGGVTKILDPYIALAAIASGTRLPMIMWRHILPNTLAPLMVNATFICASAMITEAILSFIGAGTPPTIPSWGNIMAEGRALWQVKFYIVLFPAIFLSLTVLAVNMLGDGLRDALDPRLAKRL